MLFFICVFAIHVNAQEFAVSLKHYGVEDGLLQREVYAVFEDHNGFIWLGYDKGLQRFDGHDFKSWTKSSTKGILQNISRIEQDKDQWLWLWNNNLKEYAFLNPTTEQVVNYTQRFGEDFPIKYSSENVTEQHFLYKDSKARLCFLVSNPYRLIYFDKGDEFETIVLDQFTKNEVLTIQLVDHQDNIWLTSKENSSNNIYHINAQGKTLQTYHFSGPTKLNGFYERDQEIFFRVYNEKNYGTFKINKEGPPTLFKSLNGSAVDWVRNNGTYIWELSEAAWEIYDSDGKQPLFTLDRKDYDKSLFDLINYFYEDKHKRVWIAGEWGLTKANARPSTFQKYFSFDNEQNKPINTSARGITTFGKDLYANFEFGGLVHFEKEDPSKWTILEQQLSKQELYLGRPIKIDKKGNLITGFNEQSIQYLSLDKKERTRYRVEEKIIPTDVWSLYEDEQQRIWVGLDGGLAYKNPEDESLQYITSDGLVFKERKGSNLIVQITPAVDGNLWLCTDDYLYLFDPINKKYVAKYGEKEQGAFYLPANTFYFLHIDKAGIHWIATDDGLIRWDKEENVTKLFSTIEGLSNDVIYAIFEDDHNHLWLSSDYGVMQFNKETFQVKSYLSKDGISDNEFNRTSAFQDKDGTIYFGSLNGITAFHPNDFYKEETTDHYKMLISDYRIFDGKLDALVDKTGALRMSNTIYFRPVDRFFRLKFALPTLEDATHMLYAWKIDGIDQEWNYQKDNTLQIGKLPYGEFVLKIKGQNSGGKWAEEELHINVVVSKPIYLQNWFLILLLLLTLLGIWLYNNYRVKKFNKDKDLLEQKIEEATAQIRSDNETIKKQTEELLKLDKVKSRFFANVSHELRTPLTLILGPISSILKSKELSNRNYNYLKKAQQNTKDLLKLVASILDLSKMESGKLELNEKPEVLYLLTRRIASAFESHAQQRHIHFSFIYNAEENLQLQLDEDKLEIVINNLLSNAMKFTKAGGKVDMKISDLGKNIEIIVADTGVGIHPDDLPHVFNRFYQSTQNDAITNGGTGIGLALSQEYIVLMGGNIKIKSTLGQGAVFTIELPRKEVMGRAINTESSVPEESLLQIQTTEKNKTTDTIDQQRSTILIVEDNYALRDYLESILSHHYKVLTAQNGQAALEVLQTKVHCQLVLSDIMMPVMDGYQLLEKLKSTDDYRHISVIMLTARADIQDKLKALRIGVDDYLLKPFEEEELLARIENLLKNATLKLSQDDNIEKQTDKPEKTTLSEADQNWLISIEENILQYMDDSRFSIEFLSELMGMSRRQLQRRIKNFVGLTPKEYINEVRLHEVRGLLQTGELKSVAQAAEKGGYSNANYFSQQFKKRFGKVPSEYL